jgi:TPR repeat protein
MVLNMRKFQVILVSSIFIGMSFVGNINAQSKSKTIESVQEIHAKAEHGVPEAQNNLANIYNVGAAKDKQQALEWYRKAAIQGFAKAQFNLGLMYDEGKSVPQDYKQAVEWYKKAADQGNTGGQSGLGAMYYEGKGVTKDYSNP